LICTTGYGIRYSRYLVVLEGYNGVNWISNMDELYAKVDIFSLLMVMLFHVGHANRQS
jgi:hypothetical protein